VPCFSFVASASDSCFVVNSLLMQHWCFFFDAEAREAFIKQFSQLETSAQTLQLQLRSIATALNCNLTDSGRESEKGKTLKGENECQELVDTLSTALNMQDQLQKMTLDLNSMVSLHGSIKWVSNPSDQRTCLNGGFLCLCDSLQTSYSQVIPSVIPKEPNKWNAIVNESEVLIKRFAEILTTNLS
jgi:hypothetical protein